MARQRTILITGAAGNLGSLLASHLARNDDVDLHLMIHCADIAEELKGKSHIKIFKADLSDKASLLPCLKGVDAVIHFAGVLFRHHPEKFLPITNTQYFRNLLDAAVEHNVSRIILVSFPHVEGETTPEFPAAGKLNGKPVSVHAQTRLIEEQLLFGYASRSGFEAISLRPGMIYGREILMVQGARFFASRRLLGVWKKPTHIHLISIDDFLEAATAALLKPSISGIYHLGDDGVQTLQDFLDRACRHWGYKRPHRMPLWFIMCAAWHFEMFSMLFGVRSPLTRDFIRIGMISYYGDTARMKKELLPELKYRNLEEGIGIL